MKMNILLLLWILYYENEANLEWMNEWGFFINEKSDDAFENIQAIKYFFNNNWFYAKGD